MLQLLYGCGLRLNELLNLRIKDIDFGFDNVYIFDSKSQKDRVVPLPQRIKDELKIHIKEVRKIHQNDLSKGFGEIHLPQALERKYPNANKEFKWQFLFPMKKLSKDPVTGKIMRYHVLASTFARNLKAAANKSKIEKRLLLIHSDIPMQRICCKTALI